MLCDLIQSIRNHRILEKNDTLPFFKIFIFRMPVPTYLKVFERL